MRLARALRTLGEVLITGGVVILLFVVYTLYITGLETAREQADLRDELLTEWSKPSPAGVPAVALGRGVAILRIPRFGRDWYKVVVEGVSLADLRRGPGHYPGTQLPGQVGNFVVSGHRTTYGAPFARIDDLEPGDAIVVETKDTWFTYRVTSSEIVRPTAVDVILPVPHQPDAKPTKKLVTLTSCHPKYSARERYITYGTYEIETPKLGTGNLPPALMET